MNEVEIGTINFSENINEVEIKSISGRYIPKRIGQCKIYVYGGEGSIPHFHIYNSDETFRCCVRIYDEHFFSHGNKYKGILNSSQCRELNNWLKCKSIDGNGMTNWEFITYSWEKLNSNCLYPEYLKTNKQPHYEIMNSFRDVI